MLTIEDVSIHFGGVVALDRVGLTVPDATIVGLIGPNGAGKTTLFNCVTRAYQPHQGRIDFNGVDLLSTRPHRVVGVGIARTFQNLALFGSLSVLDNVLAGAHSRDTPRLVPSLVGWPPARRTARTLRGDAHELLADLGLSDVAGREVGGLPFGTLKRVELARALMSSPRLLLLDEPAGGLSHGEVTELGQVIQRLARERGLSVLLVEHHMGLVMGICDRVVAMELGHKIADGVPSEVQNDPRVIAAYLGGAE